MISFVCIRKVKRSILLDRGAAYRRAAVRKQKDPSLSMDEALILEGIDQKLYERMGNDDSDTGLWA